MNLKLDIAILLIAAGPFKTQAYCDMQKLADQMEEARKKNNSKTIDELSQTAVALAKTLGPEYQALIDGLQDVAKDEQLDDEFLSAFHALDSLCTR
jgi:hypothetical protein